MSNGSLNIIIGICAGTVGILAFADEIGKLKYLKFVKSLAFKIVVFVLASFFGIWATIKKDSKNELDAQADKLNNQIQQNKRDSLNRVHTDESNRKIIETFTISLAEYGLHYDSTQNKIEKTIRDTKVKELPNIEICLGPIEKFYRTKDSLTFSIPFCNTQSILASNIRVKMKMIFQRGNEFANLYNTDLFPSFVNIGGFSRKQTSFTFSSPVQNQIDRVFILLRGTCTDLNGQTTSNIYDFVLMDFHNKIFSQYNYTNDSLLYTYMKTNGFTKK